MPLHIVDAYPETSCQVSAVKNGRNAWVATGTFMNEPLSATSRSEAGAVGEWKNLAEFRYALSEGARPPVAARPRPAPRSRRRRLAVSQAPAEAQGQAGAAPEASAGKAAS